MNDKDKEAYAIYENTILQREGYLYIAREAWQAACEYKQKEIDELKSQIYEAGSIHQQGDIHREMTWKESLGMMERFNSWLKKELDELKIKFRSVQAENAKLKEAMLEISQETRVIEGVECSTNGAITAAEALKELEKK